MSTQANARGIGFPGLLGLVFITLKLCGVIDWPWLWVMAPIWIPLAFLAAIVLMALICYGIAALLK